MKTFIEKFKISAALDQPAKNPLRVPGQRRDELQGFAQEMAALDLALKGGPPRPAPHPGLHESIMAGVREARSQSDLPQAARRRWNSQARTPALREGHAWRWAMATGAVCVLLLSGWGAWHLVASRLAPSPFRNSALVERRVGELPSKVLSPLSQEWEALNLDLEKTTEFLLASVP